MPVLPSKSEKAPALFQHCDNRAFAADGAVPRRQDDSPSAQIVDGIERWPGQSAHDDRGSHGLDPILIPTDGVPGDARVLSHCIPDFGIARHATGCGSAQCVRKPNSPKLSASNAAPVTHVRRGRGRSMPASPGGSGMVRDRRGRGGIFKAIEPIIGGSGM